MIQAQPRNVGIMGLKRAKILDLPGQSGAFGQMPRRVLVATGFSRTQREVDHRQQG